MQSSLPPPSLPKMPSLADLGLTLNQIRSSGRPSNQASDGKKKVPYNPQHPRNVRAFQTAPIPTKIPHWASSKSTTYPIMTITPHGEVIAQYINKYPVLAIDSPTGTGKTRYIPYLMASKGFKVRVAIPTTVAVRDAYRFQREHSALRVGYAAGREIHYSDDDQLVYATTGHFTQRIITLIKTGKRDQVKSILGDILFVDEVHTATSYITLLIGLIRYLFPSGGTHSGGTHSGGPYTGTGPKIIFSTATFNHGDIMDFFPEFPVYKVEIPSKPIEDIFLTTPRDPIRDDPNDEIATIIRNELTRRQNTPQKYHGIVFRPGLAEVEDTIDFLETRFSPSDPIEFYPAYSNLGPNEIDEIFKESNKMKVVIGTNIIESSVTIKDVGFIIDDMLEKIAETSATGGDKLTLVIISKAGSQQRRGRTGRTIEGRAYKLITREQFELLPPFKLREIDRIPIYNIVLQLLDAGLNPRDILKISIPRYEQAQRLLLNFGMIENRADRYVVTTIGQFVSSISLGIQNAYLVYLGYQRLRDKILTQSVDLPAERILLRTVLAVACMIESYGPSYFYIPRRKREETTVEFNARRDAHIEKYHEKFRGLTDIHTFVNIFWEMMSQIDVARRYDQHTSNKFASYVKEWSQNNSMNNKKLKEFLTVMRDIESIVEAKYNEEVELRSYLPNSGQAETLPRGILGEHGFSLGRDLPRGGYENLGNIVAPMFARAYINNSFTRTVDRRNQIVYLDQKSGIYYKINRASSFNKLTINELEGPMEIVVAQTIEVVGRGGGTVHLAGIFVPKS